MVVTRVRDGVGMEMTQRIAVRRGSELERILPLDTRTIVGARTLMRMSFEAIDAAEWPRPNVAVAGQTPPAVLRTLLAFCYCSGIFPSSEIERAARIDHDIRYLCANDFPTWKEAQQFRRAHVSLLRETVARIILAVCEEIGVKTDFFACIVEADRRIRLAIEADSAVMDD
jgi:hypothetical protein